MLLLLLRRRLDAAAAVLDRVQRAELGLMFTDHGLDLWGDESPRTVEPHQARLTRRTNPHMAAHVRVEPGLQRTVKTTANVLKKNQNGLKTQISSFSVESKHTDGGQNINKPAKRVFDIFDLFCREN